MFASYPLGFSTALYRGTHFGHHRFVGTAADPDTVAMHGWDAWKWPKTLRGAIRVLLWSLFGAPTHFPHIRRWSVFRAFCFGPFDAKHQEPLTGPERALFAMWLFLLAATVAWYGVWLKFLLYWILPYSTILQVIALIRGIAEHHGLPNESELAATRSVSARIAERLVFAPLHSGYHLEHHLFPSVPFYNLPKLHRILAADPAFRAGAARADSYLVGGNSVIRQLTVNERA